MSWTERKASESATKVKALAADFAGEPVHAACIMMPTGTYKSGSVKQFYDTDDQGEFVNATHVDATLNERDQLLLVVTESQVRHFVVRPKTKFGRLTWKKREERLPFSRTDLEVNAEHPDGLARFLIREPSTGREATYETWTTYGAAPNVQDMLRWLKTRPGEEPLSL